MAPPRQGAAIGLGTLAERIGVELRGDADVVVSGAAPLERAQAGEIAFVANERYLRWLPETRAGAVILAPAHAASCPVPVLVSSNPYLSYARAADLLYPQPPQPQGIHPSAVVAADCRVHPDAWIGPCVVIGAGCEIAAGVVIGPGSVLGADCRIGADSRLEARVVLGDRVVLGRGCQISAGAVIGSDGFGYAKDGCRWVKVPQLGSVRLGDAVHVGANTTIDRGALDDTLIGDGVKLDNLIQIAHNVEVGEHSAMAGCVGIAGSTKIGKYCTLGGGVGVSGHLEIGDNVHFSGMSLVTRSFTEPGSYSGNVPAVPTRDWRRMVVRLRQLDELANHWKVLRNRWLPEKTKSMAAAGSEET